MDSLHARRYANPIEHAAELIVADVQKNPSDYQTTDSDVIRSLYAQVLSYNQILYLDENLLGAILRSAYQEGLRTSDSGTYVRKVFQPTDSLIRTTNEDGNDFADRARCFVSGALVDGPAHVRVTTRTGSAVVTALSVAHSDMGFEVDGVTGEASVEWDKITMLEI